jgi:hypothetical protein
MKALLAPVLALLMAAACARAATLPASQSKDSALLAALRQGGCVILMRDVDDEGLADARAMGDALRQMRIPIGEVMSSPTSRARETIAAARLCAPQTFAQLGDAGHSSSQKAVPGPSKWLRQMVSRRPPAGSNALLVTQMPNISDAYGRPAAALKPGGALIFRPDGHGDAHMLAVMQIGDWTQLAAQFKR